MTDVDALIAEQGVRWSSRLAAAAVGELPVDEASDGEWSAWRDAVDPDRSGLFERRLEWDSLTDSDARRMLAGPPVVQAEQWQTELAALRAAVDRTAEHEQPDLPFQQVLCPLVEDVITRLRAERDPVWWQALSTTAAEALQHDLGRRLAEVTGAAFLADFTADRPEGSAVMARMGWGSGGSTALEEWCRDQAAGGLVPILTTYPVLGRLLSVTTLTWSRSTRAMLERLHRHRHDIARVLGIPADAPLLAIDAGLSDPHRGGHRVAILDFGSHGRVVYKPKDLRIERRFQQLVQQVNDWFGDDALVSVQVVTGDGPYGFTSYLSHRRCPEAELAAFYESAGRLAALLYLLGATDAHHENVMACGARVALIDPETLLHAAITGGPAQEAGPLGDTVLRTGMMPTWMVTGREQVAFDPSALGISAPTGKSTAEGWLNVNTDDMVRGPVPVAPTVPLSLPVAAGNPLEDHVEDLLHGFREVCSACAEPGFRDLLLGALPDFAGLPQRVVLRATRVYAQIMRDTQSPEALRTANARAMHLERLSRSALVSDRRDPWWQVFHAELQEMEDLDIPYFTHVLGTQDVIGALGAIDGLVSGDPLQQAADRITGMDPEALAWQERLIRGAVRARFSTADPPQFERTDEHQAPWSGPYPVAGILADLHESAVPTGDTVTWLTLSRLPDGHHLRLGMIGDDWYDGRTGISAVQHIAGAPHDLAQATVAPTLQKLTHPDPYVRFRFLRDLGLGFTGVGGLLRWLALPSTENAPALRDRMLADLSVELITRDRHHDLIGGSAGLIGPLAHLVRSGAAPDAAVLLEAATSHLYRLQSADGGWPTRLGQRPLTGYAHGAAGCGLALLEAGTAMGRDDWIDAAAAAFAYERSVYDPEARNWPDFRGEGLQPPMVAWCHGAPGIGLSRLRALHLLPDHREAEQWHADVVIAMETTATAPATRTDHLCCGLTGRAAILRIAGRYLSEPRWLSAADELTDVVVRGRRDHGHFTLPMDTDQMAPAPGLMTGCAGIAAHLTTTTNDEDLSAFLL